MLSALYEFATLQHINLCVAKEAFFIRLEAGRILTRDLKINNVWLRAFKFSLASLKCCCLSPFEPLSTLKFHRLVTKAAAAAAALLTLF